MKFVIATHNQHKCEEFQRILKPLEIEIVMCDLPEVEETGQTLAENAFIKAKSAFEASGLASIADDTGLMVDALGGAPGVFSSRYAGEGASYDDVIKKLLFEMRDVPEGKRGAYFESAICCIFPNGEKLQVQGRCYGTIAFERSGSAGFGYDPVFLVGGKSFAEMNAKEKDELSHRGIALRKFTKILSEKINKGVK